MANRGGNRVAKAKPDPDDVLALITSLSLNRSTLAEKADAQYDLLLDAFSLGQRAGLSCRAMGEAAVPPLGEGAVATALRRRRDGRKDYER